MLYFFFFLMIRRPPRSTLSSSSAASDVYKRQEYDAGGDYSGGNFATSNRVCRPGEEPGHVRRGGETRTIWPCIPWGDWLSSPPAADGTVHPQAAQLTLAEYPWQQLDSLGWSVRFESTGEWSAFKLSFSLSGAAAAVTLELDGEHLEFDRYADRDRHFYEVLIRRGLGQGGHRIVFKQFPIEPSSNIESSSAAAVRVTAAATVCHVMLHEYSSGYVFEHGHVGAFPVFSDPGKLIGWRPTDKSCLMRDMATTELCNVCQHSIWQRFVPAYTKLYDTQLPQATVATDGTHELSLQSVFAPVGLNQSRVRILWRPLESGAERAGLSVSGSADSVGGCWTVSLQVMGRSRAGAMISLSTQSLSFAAGLTDKPGAALQVDPWELGSPCPHRRPEANAPAEKERAVVSPPAKIAQRNPSYIGKIVVHNGEEKPPEYEYQYHEGVRARAFEGDVAQRPSFIVWAGCVCLAAFLLRLLPGLISSLGRRTSRNE
eukprot:TRINITY_DN17215_c0_g2_i1.p1 TRINITY_DN17215_c0_g2~~TRINITY_DN17215_c0_g2_i1.p1  ORF type:complete len:487 (+),score=65.54 TRINITY_DN17215_c0_g2_i1:117-1577(+)